MAIASDIVHVLLDDCPGPFDTMTSCLDSTPFAVRNGSWPEPCPGHQRLPSRRARKLGRLDRPCSAGPHHSRGRDRLRRTTRISCPSPSTPVSYTHLTLPTIYSV